MARGSGDGHGGARPWLGRLRRDDDVAALVVYSTSFSVTHITYRKGEKGRQGARVAQPHASSAGGGHGDPVEPRSRGGLPEAKNGMTVGSQTWRSSRWGYGLDESDQGARLRWIFGSAAATASRSPCSRGGRRWQGEMASERASGETLAFNWSSDARRGDAGRACAPRGDQLLSRSATASSVRFLKR